MNGLITNLSRSLLTAGALAATLTAAAADDVASTSPAALSNTTECILSYRITRGNGDDEGTPRGANMRIRDTLWGLGNGTWALGPGELVLRVPSDGTNEPAPGKVEIIGYRLKMNFSAGSGVTVTNRITASARHPKDPTRAVATGHLRLGPRPVIDWLPCTLPPGYDEDEESYTPDVIGYGPGCLAPYHSIGNVRCDGMLCWAGDLEEGDNPQAETWEQALKPLRLDADLSRFHMGFMLVPNRMPSRTFVSLEGRLVSKRCQ